MLGIDSEDIIKWEKEFSQIRPVRNRAGNRSFLERDLPILFYIKESLVDRQMTIEETRTELRNHKKREIESETLHLKKILAEIRLEIGEIRKLFKL